MLPKNLKYQNKVESQSANAYTSNIQPQNGMGAYTGGQTIIINIPTRNNLVLVGSESTLKFSLSVTTGGANTNYLRLDRGGAHSCIQRLRLYHGSNLLEDIDNYNLLAANMIALQKSCGASKGKYNITSGMRYESVVTDASRQIYDAPAGEKLYNGAEFPGAVIAAGTVTTARTYTISLLSILGSLGSQYLPLFAMTSAPLRLELQLCATPQLFTCADAALPAAFSINNCEYVASFIELSDTSMAIINQSLGGQPLQYVVSSYRNYVYNNTIVNNATTQISVPIPAKFSSLKALVGSIRNKSAGAVTFFPLASTHFGLSQYTIRLGSKVIPAKAPATVAEYFVELCKSVGSVSDLSHMPNINMITYNVLQPVANGETNAAVDETAFSACFMTGCDFEAYANADKDAIFAGYNTNQDDIYWQYTFTPGNVGGDIAARFDHFAMYDSLLICENGTCYVKF